MQPCAKWHLSRAGGLSSPALSPVSCPPGCTLPSSCIRCLPLCSTPEWTLTSFFSKQGRTRHCGKAASCCLHPDTCLCCGLSGAAWHGNPRTGKPQPHGLHRWQGPGTARAPRVTLPGWDKQSWVAFLAHHLPKAAASSFWHWRVCRRLSDALPGCLGLPPRAHCCGIGEGDVRLQAGCHGRSPLPC